MKTGKFLYVAGWLMCCSAVFGAGQPSAPKPNMIYVLVDDMGWGDVGFNGQKKIRTPHIDQLAQEGAVLENFYAASPVCGPSRASLMTGLHQGHCKIRGNPKWSAIGKPIDLDASDTTFPQELQRAGYATACFGKWGLNENMEANTGNPLKQGFDIFWGFNKHGEAHFHWPDYVWHNGEKVDLGGESNWMEKKTYADDLFAEKAIKFIEQAGERPFFIYLAFTAPHLGISVPEDSQLPYRDRGWPERSMSQTGHYHNDPEGNVSYAGMVSRIDGYMKRLIECLRKQGLDKNTLIIFSSDNGPEYDKGFFDSNGMFTGKKRNVTEGGIRMPGFAYWPGTIRSGTVVEHPCAFWDIYPTFCELAGVEPSVPVDGISMVPALTGHPEKQQTHEYLYWEFNERKGPMQAVRFGKWKAIRLWNMKRSEMGAVQLYDLETDPSEQNNLAKSHPEKADQALRYMHKARREDPAYPLMLLTNALNKK